MDLLSKIKQVGQLVGNTKTYKLNFDKCNLYAKLEYNNFMGSVKDRPAYYAFKDAIENNLINENTTIVESSSGNFALGLAGICKCLGLKFIAVVDPHITWEKEKHLSFLAHKIVKVQDPDPTGGYLLSRIRMVRKLLRENENHHTINQYENPNNFLTYYNTMGQEINDKFSDLHYAFVAVSTGGTITGLSLKLKEKFPNLKMIGVDIEGSLVFSDKPKKRSISGLGSSKRSSFIKNAKINDVIILPQVEIEQGCIDLFKEQSIFAGGSSGAVYAAAKRYLAEHGSPNENAVIICPDRGHAYVDAVYNKHKDQFNKKLETKLV